MPCFPLALSLAGLTHPLALGFSRLRPADGGAGQPRVAVAASQLPPQFGPSQQTGLALHRDPLTPFPGQIPDAAQTGRTVAGPHAARHLWSWKTQSLRRVLKRLIGCFPKRCALGLVVDFQSLTFGPVEAVRVDLSVCLRVSVSVRLSVLLGRSPLSSVTAPPPLRDRQMEGYSL